TALSACGSSHHLHRSLGPLRAAEQIGLGLAAGAAVAEREAARTAQVVGILVDLAVRGRDDEAVLVIGDRHRVVHVLYRLPGKADALRDILVDDAVDRFRAHI